MIDDARIFARVQILTGLDDENMINQLIADAKAWILVYTGRKTIPDELETTVGDLAIVEFNRLGTQGESARTEGGESYTFETAPAKIVSILNRYRLLRAGGKYHETTET